MVWRKNNFIRRLKMIKYVVWFKKSISHPWLISKITTSLVDANIDCKQNRSLGCQSFIKEIEKGKIR